MKTEHILEMALSKAGIARDRTEQERTNALSRTLIISLTARGRLRATTALVDFV